MEPSLFAFEVSSFGLKTIISSYEPRQLSSTFGLSILVFFSIAYQENVLLIILRLYSNIAISFFQCNQFIRNFQIRTHLVSNTLIRLIHTTSPMFTSMANKNA